ncbi:MAG: hypothetical protein P0S95_05960 [Rhabdochlamydiaceae bacterium]|nr:hypothetical protein [Candidatus Amphrikana amoebophyrae]
MNRIFVFGMLVLLVACNKDGVGIDKRQAYSDQVKLAFAKKYQNKGFSLIGIGGSELDGKTTGFSLTFETDKLYDISKARQLLLEMVQQFWKEINSDINLRSYLCEIPFPLKNIRIGVISIVPDANAKEFENIFYCDHGVLVFLKKQGVVVYNIPVKHVETYEEAVRIEAESKMDKLNSVSDK